jgi:hypothetical protein
MSEASQQDSQRAPQNGAFSIKGSEFGCKGGLAVSGLLDCVQWKNSNERK